MRSSYGRFAQQLRLKRGMNQKEFAELSGMSMSHISNLEHQRAHLNDEVIGTYIKVLDCTGPEAHELRKRAETSNRIRKHPEPNAPTTPLEVLFQQFGSRLSQEARLEIQKILEAETGERLQDLTFASNRSKKHAKKRIIRRPSLLPERLAEIAILAEKARLGVCGEMEKVDIGLALERLSHTENGLDYEVREALPPQLEGAFAAILGHSQGHTILLEEERFRGAINGVHFARHVVAHEVAHHYLHASLLESESELYLAPQELAKNGPADMGSSGQIEQVVDTIEEEEAECFATFFLVPWPTFLKGTEYRYLADDYGEQQRTVERFGKYFNNKAVLDAFRWALWNNGVRRHPVFRL